MGTRFFIDREGFEWNKHCMTCDKFSPRGKPFGDPLKREDTHKTYCRGYDVYSNEEPFNSYEKAGAKNNDCPKYHKSC